MRELNAATQFYFSIHGGKIEDYDHELSLWANIQQLKYKKVIG